MFREFEFIVLGGSRGIGSAILHQLVKNGTSCDRLLSCSRQPGIDHRWPHQAVDFTKPEGYSDFFAFLDNMNAKKIIYCAGGGPYGDFAQQKWAAHEWAYRLNLLFPALLLHKILNYSEGHRPQQLVFLGSAIADSRPDPSAASYASAKHGLRGLIQTVVLEKPQFDLRFYSPGYVDTSLIPPRALVRQQQPLWQPAVVAQDLLDWLEAGPRYDHRLLADYP